MFLSDEVVVPDTWVLAPATLRFQWHCSRIVILGPIEVTAQRPVRTFLMDAPES
ncbi:hypothetical protein QFZ79_000548 [Arthrobacter sp. V4I6]|nr:hypothetical protein [Arthrobacter sp. V1I7]MDQ0852437.1 hypothetical protein [Arthrobacter sp. V4I6]